MSSNKKSKTVYSYNKIAPGLNDLIKKSYLSGVNNFVLDIDSLYNEKALDTLIKDFSNFESVIKVTNENLDSALKGTNKSLQEAQDIIKREKIPPIKTSKD